ncbi:Dol-P-Glc:Glc(2)Man(9)GlcNAc(2)-PP-Dol alpha-1,2-glucosyltransferase [Fusarium oxysporum f. sp. albedinis]|nr:Dol-P-Glc:Glc(2)Man(9)GlcNAc(2)-PP-Dol alpha-1,2-glucosyltransferase [Fusarium oxysporum f. sp. albedinis]
MRLSRVRLGLTVLKPPSAHIVLQSVRVSRSGQLDQSKRKNLQLLDSVSNGMGFGQEMRNASSSSSPSTGWLGTTGSWQVAAGTAPKWVSHVPILVLLGVSGAHPHSSRLFHHKLAGPGVYDAVSKVSSLLSYSIFRALH